VRPQVAFNGGRILGFAAGGAVLGMLGSAFEIPTTVLAVGVLAAAVVMTILGVRLTGLSPRIAAWSPTLPGRWGRRAAGGAGSYTDWRALSAGAATFVLPCGFTQAMQIYAVSTGSPAQAAAVMAAFAVGTAPGLLGLGIATGAASAKGGSVALRFVGVVVLAFALVTAGSSLRTLGVELPSLGGSTPTAVSSNVTLAGGTQTVTMTQLADAYSPADTTVYAGIPIRWVIESEAPYTCAAFLRVPDLGVRADLAPGTNTVDLPALDEGTTPFSCSMGMYSGTLTAIPPPA
jgi:sulfite exporter TauE/SafE